MIFFSFQYIEKEHDLSVEHNFGGVVCCRWEHLPSVVGMTDEIVSTS
jgi:hypothetical protein